MPVTHVNRKRDTYYLHAGKTKTGKPGTGSQPKSMAISSKRFRRVRNLREPRRPGLSPQDREATRDPGRDRRGEGGLETLAPGQNCVVDVQGKQIVVYLAERGDMYQKMLRFILDDKKDRTYRVQRWCFKGSIDDWIDLWMSGGLGQLPVLVQTFCPHLGRDSFYDLM